LAFSNGIQLVACAITVEANNQGAEQRAEVPRTGMGALADYLIDCAKR